MGTTVRTLAVVTLMLALGGCGNQSTPDATAGAKPADQKTSTAPVCASSVTTHTSAKPVIVYSVSEPVNAGKQITVTEPLGQLHPVPIRVSAAPGRSTSDDLISSVVSQVHGHQGSYPRWMPIRPTTVKNSTDTDQTFAVYRGADLMTGTWSCGSSSHGTFRMLGELGPVRSIGCLGTRTDLTELERAAVRVACS